MGSFTGVLLRCVQKPSQSGHICVGTTARQRNSFGTVSAWVRAPRPRYGPASGGLKEILVWVSGWVCVGKHMQI